MNEHELITYAERILVNAGGELPEKMDVTTFGEFAENAMYAAKAMRPQTRARHYPEMRGWLDGFLKLYHRFDVEVKQDPMILYRPKHHVSEAFHASEAFVRYYMAGNGTSKTQTGVAEHYYTTTHQHPYKNLPRGQNHTALIGLSYTKYMGGVFEPKFLTGETGNVVSPLFPPDGKWLHRYDKKSATIVVACPECANKGQARDCPHPKSSIRLFSDEGGWEVLQGANYRLVHFDEHVNEGFFNEARQRVIRVEKGSMIVTGTPLFGLEAWEIRRLYKRAIGNPEKNLRIPGKSGSGKYVELFMIDQFEAGIVPHDEIRMSMQDMDEFEIRARVYGKPGPLAKKPVFDRAALSKMNEATRDPHMYALSTEVPLEHFPQAHQIVRTNLGIEDREHAILDPWTGVCVWEEPEPGEIYVMGIDSAKGLYKGDVNTSGDASACSVFKVKFDGMVLKLQMVAQFHGWINLLEYGDEVYKLGTWYNSAMAVIETTGGYGEAVLMRLKNQLFYSNIYAGHGKESQNKPVSDTRVGVDTNQSTKPMMVSLAQRMVKNLQMEIPCKYTLDEMIAFEQVDVGQGGARLRVPRFEGTGGAHDDRTMSVVIAASIAQDQTLFNPLALEMARKQEQVNLPPNPIWDDLRKDLNGEHEEII
jgi:hypothetical protein